MIARRALDLPAKTGSMYPEPYRSRVLPREKRALGDEFGLTTIGVNLTILMPGKESSMRHWHVDPRFSSGLWRRVMVSQ